MMPRIEFSQPYLTYVHSNDWLLCDYIKIDFWDLNKASNLTSKQLGQSFCQSLLNPRFMQVEMQNVFCFLKW